MTIDYNVLRPNSLKLIIVIYGTIQIIIVLLKSIYLSKDIKS